MRKRKFNIITVIVHHVMNNPKIRSHFDFSYNTQLYELEEILPNGA